MTHLIEKKLTVHLWTKYLLLIFFLVNLTVVLFNYVVDPYQQYRKATLYTFTIQDQRYLNAGLAKNYDYDTLVIGSSMTENFSNSDFEKKPQFYKVIKLPLQGASIFEEGALIKTALHSKKINNIIFGLDIASFGPNAQKLDKLQRFPTYLYDSNYFNDFSYLLNFKVFKKSIKSLKNPYDETNIGKQINTIYNWQNLYKNSFKISTVLNYYHTSKSMFESKSAKEQQLYRKKFSLSVLKSNFNNELLPIIQNNPDINFYLFYPPYSILAFKMMYETKILSDIINFKKYIFNSLSHNKNVKIYDFQIAKKVMLNLHNYKDTNHYSEDINKWIANQITTQNYLVTKDNLKRYSQELFNYAKTYKVQNNAI